MYSYVLSQLTPKTEKSAKFIYCQTVVKGGGSDGRTNSQLTINKGVSQESLCSSYKPDGTCDETWMTTNDISSQAFKDALLNEEKSYFNVNTDINSIAQAVRDNNGVVIGVTGQNNGTWLSTYPAVPTKGEWNHWLYAGKAKLINGVKYIGFINSWGITVGDKGWQWIPEAYFNGTWIWSGWTEVFNVVIPFTFTKTLRMGDTGLDVKMLQTKLGIPADGKFGKQTQATVIAFQKTHNLTPDGIVGPKTNAVLNTL